MFDRELSKRLIQQLELFDKYHDKVDKETLKQIMQNRGLKSEKINNDHVAA